jgi:hypothetical protein
LVLIIINGCVEERIPVIKITPLSYDLGKIPQAPIEKTFMVMNNGDGLLEIKSITTSCGCTKAKINKEKINPGDSAELIISFSPNLDNMTGKTLVVAYVKSNDPQKPEVEVELTSYIVK